MDSPDERGSPPSLPRQAVRGLAVGAVTIAAAIAIAYIVLQLDRLNTGPCDSDLVCLPNMGLFMLAMMSALAVVVFGGPRVARLMRVPRPRLFAIPAAWVALLACVGLGPADQQDRWPFNDAASSLLIVWIPYGLIGVWAFRRRAA